MRTETLTLSHSPPGTRHQLLVHRFGSAGARPKAYVQAALHADEVPAILVTQVLRRSLEQLESEGRMAGEVVLVPYANPLGLAQDILGQHCGRFDLHDGGNFNRGFADLSEGLAGRLHTHLGDDETSNVNLIREALRSAVAGLAAGSSAADLKRQLLLQAIDADIVLDLHCDSEAVMHLYALTPQAAIAAELGAALGAQAVLLATDSGGSPFDEACTRPWHLLQQQYSNQAVPLACFAATVELRGEADTSHALASQDAQALVDFLAWRGVLRGPSRPLPAPRCDATPLAASEPVLAPHAGLVVFHRQPGEQVAAGDAIADLIDPQDGVVTTLRCQSSGVLYARCGSRWALAGKRLAKIAGTQLARSGTLLSP